MSTPGPNPNLVQFSVFELDLQNSELRKQGVKVKLQDQPLKILQLLLETPGQIVSRDQLRSRIWPADTFVEFDKGLYSAMARLRDALGDTSDSPRFIETVPKRGYRFIAPVTVPVAPLPDGSPPQTRPESARAPLFPFRRVAGSLVAGIFGGALLLLSVLALNIAGARDWIYTRTHPIHSIAVLPLENLSRDPEQEYFADGMTDELITGLAKLGNFRVVSRTSVMHYKKVSKPLAQIGRELNVDAVVEGTVERVGTHLRIRVQLVHADTDRHLWAQTYDRELSDTLLLQSQAAGDIVREIQSSLTPVQKQQLGSARQVIPAAHEAYLKGLYFSNKRSASNFRHSIEYYRQAIAIDPGYALAYTGLAESYLGLYLNGAPSADARENARQTALKSAELAPDLPEAHLALGTVKEFFDWDWPAADDEYRQAIAMNRNSAVSHQDYAIFLTWQGRFDEAIREAQRSQDLDPVSPFIRTTYCLNLRLARRYDQAIQKCREALDLDPEFLNAYGNLGSSFEGQGQYEAAFEQFEKQAVLEGRPPEQIADARKAFHELGMTGLWRELLQQLKSDERAEPYWIARLCSRLKQSDQVFEWLEKAYQLRSPLMEQLKTEEAFDNVRADPRFQDLLRRLRLQ